MKTAERAHTPAKLWERIKLSKNYNKALEQIDSHLLYWNKFLIHKCKQRLTRLTQVAITERRLALREDERHYVGVKHKVKRREENRERKALSAAKIEKAIEKELLDRLKSGAYGDKPLNVDEKIWKKVLGHVEDEEGLEEELEEDYDEELDEDEEDDSDVGEIEYVEDDGDEELVDVEDLERWLDGSDSEGFEDDDKQVSETDDSDSDDEDANDKKRKKQEAKDERAKKRRARVEVEYEEEPLQNSVPIHN
ncbi:hypothetical protein WICMUC_004505 [Wickerhamomyces mucosus]|uniref:Protein MAK16 n=1 Tax=Wickerhamomyces mucosus TaxID=1378264 RepID=A0A9P8PGR2_9ASCO|nr:hypothetical protein WICMUC_004505 [Wickerhamomyces mucosus]